MGAFTNILLGKSAEGESPPEEVVVSGTEIKQAFEAVQENILGAVDGKLDDRLKAFDPILASFKAKEEKEREEKEEKEAIEKINIARAKRGLAPLVAEKDDMDDKDKKKAPGRHEKSKSKSEEKDEDKKKDDDKDARLDKLEGKIDGILKGIQQAGLGVQDPLSSDVIQNGNSENQLTLKNNGKTIPFEKSWDYALVKAPAMKSAMQENGFSQDAIDEFDIAVANLKFDLKKEGVQPPVRRGAFA